MAWYAREGERHRDGGLTMALLGLGRLLLGIVGKERGEAVLGLAQKSKQEQRQRGQRRTTQRRKR